MPNKVQVVGTQQVDAVVVVNASCLFSLNTQPLLMVELGALAAEIPLAVMAVRLTSLQAEELETAGVGFCEVSETPPETLPGQTATRLGVLSLGGALYEVYETRSSGIPPVINLVLVSVTSVPVIDSLPA